ncbi:MAG: D-alanine--D-alanine ligase [Deltaproteobacteria bacterium]
MKVGLTYNIKKVGSKESEYVSSLPPDFFAEWDDEDTIESVRKALSIKHDVIMIEADEGAYKKLKSGRPQIIFNIAEGLWGQSRESQIPAMLDMLRIPYTGSGPLILGICLDKARAKEILSYHDIPTAGFFVAHSPLATHHSPLSYPLIVKPLYEGSSKGIRNNSIVNDETELRERIKWIITEYNQPALVEEFLDGREFTVAMLGNDSGLKILPIVEINYSSLPAGMNPIYSYEAKWIWDTPDSPLEIFKCPADIDNRLKDSIEKICRDAFNVLDIKDWCRIDIRLDMKGQPHILELNPLPGILPDPKSNSCFPKAARAAGMGYDGLINAVLEAACKRHGLKP